MVDPPTAGTHHLDNFIKVQSARVVVDEEGEVHDTFIFSAQLIRAPWVVHRRVEPMAASVEQPRPHDRYGLVEYDERNVARQDQAVVGTRLNVTLDRGVDTKVSLSTGERRTG